MQQNDSVSLTIDGREVSVPRGTTVLRAAEQLGIEIPTFCYSKKMDPLGACRMCLVSIEKAKGFPPACATPVAPGMVVHTVSPDVVKTQQGILEFLLINHPLDCPICDKGGECPLQNLTFKYGPGKSRYVEEKRHFVKHLPIGPQIVLDRERCIVCQLCVRFMEDVADDPQIVLMSRGGKTEVNVFPDRPFDSIFAGNTIELCPVGALTSSKYRFKARPWDLEHAPSICPGCAVGCNVTLDTRRNELLRLMSRDNIEVDDGWLCDIGRFGTLDRLKEGERITSPMIRRSGVLEEVSWHEALSAAASGLTRAAHSGVAALADARSTNEELYLLARLFRTVLRSPHIAMPGGSPAPTEQLGGGHIADLEHADVIVLVDADPVARQHVLDLRLKKQIKRRGVPVVIVSNDQTGLDYVSRARVGFDPADPASTIRHLVELVGPLASPPHDDAAAAQGIVAAVTSALSAAKDAVVSAARDAADSVLDSVRDAAVPETPGEPDPLEPAAALLRGARNGVVLYDERLVGGASGSDIVAALRTLADRIAPEATERVFPLALAAAANSRGAAEMGAHGGLLAGGVPWSDTDERARLGKSWGLQPVGSVGLDGSAILEGARDGSLRGLFLLNHDPIRGDNSAAALKSLEGLGFVVVQAAQTSALLQYADVVLPCATFAESHGTYTNTEGRVQRIHPALKKPDDVRDGWQILTDLAAALDADFQYHSAEDVTQEIARITGLPAWQGLAQRALAPVAAGEVR